jgi:hypothetical protein
MSVYCCPSSVEQPSRLGEIACSCCTTRSKSACGLPSLLDGPHHAIQASESIDLLGVAQLGRIGEIRTDGDGANMGRGELSGPRQA